MASELVARLTAAAERLASRWSGLRGELAGEGSASKPGRKRPPTRRPSD